MLSVCSEINRAMTMTLEVKILRKDHNTNSYVEAQKNHINYVIRQNLTNWLKQGIDADKEEKRWNMEKPHKDILKLQKKQSGRSSSKNQT